MSLYNLPKDLLIKIIAQIRQDVLDEVALDLRLLEAYKKMSGGSKINKCRLCDNLHVISWNPNDEEYCLDDDHVETIRCNSCNINESVVYCDFHNNPFTKFSCGPDYLKVYVCEEHLYIYTESDEWVEVSKT